MSSTFLELIKTSVIVGALYTLTGPNLAALATLSGTDLLNHDDDLKDTQKKKKRQVDTFSLGLRWGIGNSIGIVAVGVILISLQSNDPADDWVWMDYWLGITLQVFVGVFLIILGIYGLCKALKNRELNLGTTDDDLRFEKESNEESCSDDSVGGSAITEIVMNRKGVVLESLSDSEESPPQQGPVRRLQSDDSIVNQMVTCLDSNDDDHSVQVEDTLGLSEFDMRMWKAAKALTDNIMLYADDDWSDGSKSLGSSFSSFDTINEVQKQRGDLGASVRTVNSFHRPEIQQDTCVLTKDDDTKKPVTRSGQNKSTSNVLRKMSNCGTCLFCTPAVLAFFAGLVHGLSGHGEVLGVVPAIQLKQVHLAILYLGTFCVTSTLVMSGYTAFYGYICKWLVEKAGKEDELASLSRVFLIEFGSACLSIIVGIVWLTLLAIGQLDPLM